MKTGRKMLWKPRLDTQTRLFVFMNIVVMGMPCPYTVGADSLAVVDGAEADLDVPTLPRWWYFTPIASARDDSRTYPCTGDAGPPRLSPPGVLL